MCQVANEARVVPLLNYDGEPSQLLHPVVVELRAKILCRDATGSLRVPARRKLAPVSSRVASRLAREPQHGQLDLKLVPEITSALKPSLQVENEGERILQTFLAHTALLL